MPGLRPFALMQTDDQWVRCAHWQTRLHGGDEGIELGFQPVQPDDAPTAAPKLAAGLAFDAECRFYRSDPERGEVERSLWSPADAWGHTTGRPSPSDLIGPSPSAPVGDFAPAEPVPPLREPRGLAVDVDDRLFVAESGARRLLVLDLWSRRVLRTVPLPGAPLGLACAGGIVWAALADPAGLVRLRARTELVDVPLPAAAIPGGATPQRLAVSRAGELHVLYRDDAGGGWVVALHRPDELLAVANATDLAFDGEDALVVARRPGESFQRFRAELDGWIVEAPLTARGYDGLGIAVDPEGRVVFWTSRGLRRATTARVRYLGAGRVSTYRLDSGAFQTEWGRIFLDACVPDGTTIGAHFATSDEDDGAQTIPRDPPQNVVDVTIARPDLSPPTVPIALAAPLNDTGFPFHRRESGRELPWTRHGADDPLETYEAPVEAPPGRYLWVTLELRGDTRSTPRVAGLRAEHPSHDLVRRLPRAFSRDAVVADFLRRYLAIYDGTLSDLDARGAERRALVDPCATPQELLDWLAAFLGLTLDERWPAAARRRLIEEANCLFRFRGTIHGLARYLELYLGAAPILIEHWRLRGLGSGLAGDPGDVAAAGAVVGATFRVGGAVSAETETPLAGTVEDAFARHAHRFTVVVPRLLGTVERDVVQHVLDVHRPAHTLVDICSVGTGMRVGRGLHLGLISLIGRTGGFTTLRLDQSRLGRGGIVGRPDLGTAPGLSRLGRDTWD